EFRRVLFRSRRGPCRDRVLACGTARQHRPCRGCGDASGRDRGPASRFRAGRVHRRCGRSLAPSATRPVTSGMPRAFLVAVVLLAGLALDAHYAVAGMWTQVVCAGNGPAPIEGMTPLSAGTAATATDRCNPATGG